MPLKLMYITNDPEIALIAEKYGVDRIWVDLETLGKEERQGHINSVKSHHSIENIKTIKPLLTQSEMLVRVNPINPNSHREINDVIEAGADIIMLPMWKTTDEVKNFIGFVDGRAKTTLLLETREAVDCLDEVLDIDGIDEIHIGLNDLHLSYGLTFMFELLSNGTVEMLCKMIKRKNIPYGFGGIARIGEGMLPAEKIIQEHYRLGSTRAILSRSFCNTEIVTDIHEIDSVFGANMKKLRDYECTLIGCNEQDYKANQRDVRECVENIVKSIEKKRALKAV